MSYECHRYCVSGTLHLHLHDFVYVDTADTHSVDNARSVLVLTPCCINLKLEKVRCDEPFSSSKRQS